LGGINIGRRKLIYNYSKKDIDKEVSHLPKETIELYKGYVRDKTKGDLKQIREIIDDNNELTATWFKVIALEVFRELGGK